MGPCKAPKRTNTQVTSAKDNFRAEPTLEIGPGGLRRLVIVIEFWCRVFYVFVLCCVSCLRLFSVSGAASADSGEPGTETSAGGARPRVVPALPGMGWDGRWEMGCGMGWGMGWDGTGHGMAWPGVAWPGTAPTWRRKRGAKPLFRPALERLGRRRRHRGAQPGRNARRERRMPRAGRLIYGRLF